MSSLTRWLSAVATVATAAALSGCGSTVINPVTGQAERSVMDEPAEIALGQKAHQQVLKEQRAYANPKVQAYVDTLGQKLAAQSHRANLPWTFTVLDSPEVNAFALPGGYVYVTRGIMACLDSEAELVGVIGHEIGHVTARHGAQRATQQQTAGLGVLAATVLGAVLEGAGVRGATDLAGQVSQAAAAGYIASYSREQESQADELGAEYLARNHYNPQNMVDVIQVLKSQEQFTADTARAEGRQPPAGNSWLASHPSNDQRLADIRHVALQYASAATRYDDDGRSRYLQAVEGMAFGDAREDGVVRGQLFVHEGLGVALTAPQGWRVRNSAAAITLVNAAGDAGLVVTLLPPSAQGSHEDLLRQLLKASQNRVEGRTDKRSLHGLSATHFDGVVRNAQGGATAVHLTLADGPQSRRYLMRYVARDATALQRADAQTREAEASFRAMTSADREAARPWLIKVVPFPKGGFAELARDSVLADFMPLMQAENQLRLMNSAYGAPGDADTGHRQLPRPGQRVKTLLH
ncbi:MAG: M48 family metalloprotease [Proteobacteria bacterium]|uniref:M48 family metalloprotease n=1 Tax=Aquabacterium sp. TaxID=1872578 RepID=UPI0035C6EA08|nr:M48 family metalloprotease [Pseudomonadota bacterium]